MWQRIYHGLYQIGIAVDQLVNVILGNPFSYETWADETMSSRCGRIERQPYRTYRIVIDLIFRPFQGPNHCRNAFRKERDGRQLPPEARPPTGT